MADQPYGFSKAAAKRVTDAVIRVERMPYSSRIQNPQYPVISGQPAANGMVGRVGAGGISAGNNTNYGSGTVWVYGINTNTAARVNTNSSVTVYSISTTNGGIANGTWVQMSYRTSSSVLFIDSNDCGN